ncbi:MAG: DUF6263 family protein, partial [Chitinophagaceae bacterium]
YMKKVVFIILAIIGMAIIQSCQTAKSATGSKMLKFNFEKGKGYDYEMIINMDQDVMGQAMRMDMSTYYSMDVLEDDGTTKTIASTFDRFKMDMGVGGMNIKVDSDNPVPEMGGKDDPMKVLNSLLGAVKGRKFTLKVNAEGDVLEVTGLKDMAQSITDSMTYLDEKQKQEMMSKFSQQFNDQNIKDQFERVLYIFPNKEVKVGDSWKKTTKPGGMMGGQYNSTYTVKEIEGDMVILEEISTVEGIAEGTKMSGNINGTMIVDSKSGLVVSGDQDMKITTNSNGATIKLNGKTKIKGKAR